jgi:hypothetical protein
MGGPGSGRRKGLRTTAPALRNYKGTKKAGVGTYSKMHSGTGRINKNRKQYETYMYTDKHGQIVIGRREKK